MNPDNYGRLDERMNAVEEKTDKLEEAVIGREGLSIRMDRAERVLVLVTKPVVWLMVTVVGAAITVTVTVIAMRALGAKP